MIKKALLLLLFVFLILIAINWSLVIYGFEQAKGQIKVIKNAVPVEQVLSDENFPDSLKQKIRIINEVRRFAIDTIGLTNSENYTTFYDQKGTTILWNLSACDAYSFTPKTWSFPLLGSFPYKGFFDLEKAKEEREELLEQGYDARIRAVGGWSTLGWFSDPILSNMLERSEGRLADLISHELTHSTLFIKDDIQFNENLASFIGERGALMFLKAKYGKGSEELLDYIMENEDGARFTNHMLHCASLLDRLYASFEPTTSDSLKYIQKHILIDQITASLDTIHFHNERYSKIFAKGRPNNAYFMSFMRYHSSEDSLTTILENKYSNNLKDFVLGMKAFHED